MRGKDDESLLESEGVSREPKLFSLGRMSNGG